MAPSESERAQRRVAVVTGGGGGIGSYAAQELARRGLVVVAMDNGVGVQGEPRNEPTAAETARRIEAAGGTARASTVSVTDIKALTGLFEEVVEDFGSLDVVVNTAGILRYSDFRTATEDDWKAVLESHLGGYVNVLSAALPIMIEAGYGRIVGFTSGVGLARTSVNGPSYGSAKRAVAALTWQLGSLLPDGISVNAISPIAASRMITEALADHKDSPKGLDLSAMPQPEHMAPAVAYLASEEIGWCTGQVLFSAGPEVSPIAPPRLVEAVRSAEVTDFATALGTLFPVVFATGEADQRTSGGSNPRFGAVFDEPAAAAQSDTDSSQRVCVVVSDDATLGAALAAAVPAWGYTPVGVGAWQPFDVAAGELDGSFETASRTLSRIRESAGEIGAVVVALTAESAPAASTWQEVVAHHDGVVDRVVAHGGWLHAAYEQGQSASTAVRTVHLTGATTVAGRSTAQAVAQMARSANDTPTDSPFDSFSLALETADAGDHAPVAAFVARLVGAQDALPLAGGEFAAGRGRIGLRRHPGPDATFSFGQGKIPDWVDSALREVYPARRA